MLIHLIRESNALKLFLIAACIMLSSCSGSENDDCIAADNFGQYTNSVKTNVPAIGQDLLISSDMVSNATSNAKTSDIKTKDDQVVDENAGIPDLANGTTENEAYLSAWTFIIGERVNEESKPFIVQQGTPVSVSAEGYVELAKRDEKIRLRIDDSSIANGMSNIYESRTIFPSGANVFVSISGNVSYSSGESINPKEITAFSIEKTISKNTDASSAPYVNSNNWICNIGSNDAFSSRLLANKEPACDFINGDNCNYLPYSERLLDENYHLFGHGYAENTSGSRSRRDNNVNYMLYQDNSGFAICTHDKNFKAQDPSSPGVTIGWSDADVPDTIKDSMFAGTYFGGSDCNVNDITSKMKDVGGYVGGMVKYSVVSGFKRNEWNGKKYISDAAYPNLGSSYSSNLSPDGKLITCAHPEFTTKYPKQLILFKSLSNDPYAHRGFNLRRHVIENNLRNGAWKTYLPRCGALAGFLAPKAKHGWTAWAHASSFYGMPDQAYTLMSGEGVDWRYMHTWSEVLATITEDACFPFTNEANCSGMIQEYAALNIRDSGNNMCYGVWNLAGYNQSTVTNYGEMKQLDTDNITGFGQGDIRPTCNVSINEATGVDVTMDSTGWSVYPQAFEKNTKIKIEASRGSSNAEMKKKTDYMYENEIVNPYGNTYYAENQNQFFNRYMLKGDVDINTLPPEQRGRYEDMKKKIKNYGWCYERSPCIYPSKRCDYAYRHPQFGPIATETSDYDESDSYPAGVGGGDLSDSAAEAKCNDNVTYEGVAMKRSKMLVQTGTTENCYNLSKNTVQSTTATKDSTEIEKLCCIEFYTSGRKYNIRPGGGWNGKKYKSLMCDQAPGMNYRENIEPEYEARPLEVLYKKIFVKSCGNGDFEKYRESQKGAIYCNSRYRWKPYDTRFAVGINGYKCGSEGTITSLFNMMSMAGNLFYEDDVTPSISSHNLYCHPNKTRECGIGMAFRIFKGEIHRCANGYTSVCSDARYKAEQCPVFQPGNTSNTLPGTSKTLGICVRTVTRNLKNIEDTQTFAQRTVNQLMEYDLPINAAINPKVTKPSYKNLRPKSTTSGNGFDINKNDRNQGMPIGESVTLENNVELVEIGNCGICVKDGKNLANGYLEANNIDMNATNSADCKDGWITSYNVKNQALITKLDSENDGKGKAIVTPDDGSSTFSVKYQFKTVNRIGVCSDNKNDSSMYYTTSGEVSTPAAGMVRGMSLISTDMRTAPGKENYSGRLDNYENSVSIPQDYQDGAKMSFYLAGEGPLNSPKCTCTENNCKPEKTCGFKRFKKNGYVDVSITSSEPAYNGKFLVLYVQPLNQDGKPDPNYEPSKVFPTKQALNTALKNGDSSLIEFQSKSIQEGKATFLAPRSGKLWSIIFDKYVSDNNLDSDGRYIIFDTKGEKIDPMSDKYEKLRVAADGSNVRGYNSGSYTVQVRIPKAKGTGNILSKLLDPLSKVDQSVVDAPANLVGQFLSPKSWLETIKAIIFGPIDETRLSCTKQVSQTGGQSTTSDTKTTQTTTIKPAVDAAIAKCEIASGGNVSKISINKTTQTPLEPGKYRYYCGYKVPTQGAICRADYEVPIPSNRPCTGELRKAEPLLTSSVLQEAQNLQRINPLAIEIMVTLFDYPAADQSFIFSPRDIVVSNDFNNTTCFDAAFFNAQDGASNYSCKRDKAYNTTIAPLSLVNQLISKLNTTGSMGSSSSNCTAELNQTFPESSDTYIQSVLTSSSNALYRARFGISNHFNKPANESLLETMLTKRAFDGSKQIDVYYGSRPCTVLYDQYYPDISYNAAMSPWFGATEAAIKTSTFSGVSTPIVYKLGNVSFYPVSGPKRHNINVNTSSNITSSSSYGNIKYNVGYASTSFSNLSDIFMTHRVTSDDASGPKSLKACFYDPYAYTMNYTDTILDADDNTGTLTYKYSIYWAAGITDPATACKDDLALKGNFGISKQPTTTYTHIISKDDDVYDGKDSSGVYKIHPAFCQNNTCSKLSSLTSPVLSKLQGGGIYYTCELRKCDSNYANCNTTVANIPSAQFPSKYGDCSPSENTIKSEYRRCKVYKINSDINFNAGGSANDNLMKCIYGDIGTKIGDKDCWVTPQTNNEGELVLSIFNNNDFTDASYVTAPSPPKEIYCANQGANIPVAKCTLTDRRFTYTNGQVTPSAENIRIVYIKQTSLSSLGEYRKSAITRENIISTDGECTKRSLKLTNCQAVSGGLSYKCQSEAGEVSATPDQVTAGSAEYYSCPLNAECTNASYEGPPPSEATSTTVSTSIKTVQSPQKVNIKEVCFAKYRKVKEGFIFKMFTAITSNIIYKATIYMLIILWIVLTAHKMLTTQKPVMEWKQTAMRLAVVMIGSSTIYWDTFNYYVVGMALRLSDGLNQIALATLSGVENQTMLNEYSMFEPISDTIDIMTTGHFWIKLLAPIFSFPYGTGVIVSISLVLSSAQMLIALLSGIIKYISSLITMGLYLAIAPLVVIGYMFDNYKTHYESWVKNIVKCIAEQFFLFLGISIFCMLGKYLMQAMTYRRVCWQPALIIPVGKMVEQAIGVSFTYNVTLFSFWKIDGVSSNVSMIAAQKNQDPAMVASSLVSETGFSGITVVVTVCIFSALVKKFLDMVEGMAGNINNGSGGKDLADNISKAIKFDKLQSVQTVNPMDITKQGVSSAGAKLETRIKDYAAGRVAKFKNSQSTANRVANTTNDKIANARVDMEAEMRKIKKENAKKGIVQTDEEVANLASQRIKDRASQSLRKTISDSISITEMKEKYGVEANEKQLKAIKSLIKTHGDLSSVSDDDLKAIGLDANNSKKLKDVLSGIHKNQSDMLESISRKVDDKNYKMSLIEQTKNAANEAGETAIENTAEAARQAARKVSEGATKVARGIGNAAEKAGEAISGAAAGLRDGAIKKADELNNRLVNYASEELPKDLSNIGKGIRNAGESLGTAAKKTKEAITAAGRKITNTFRRKKPEPPPEPDEDEESEDENE